MAEAKVPYNIFLEIGKKKTFTGALDWPGWCRAGRDEGAAIEALLEAGPRYGRIVEAARFDFYAPQEVGDFNVVERVDGNATTDFGATDANLSTDDEPLEEGELARVKALLNAYWAAFDRAVEGADGKTLRKGPRGGGRDLESIVQHVMEAELAYLRALGWQIEKVEEGDERARLAQIREGVLEGLEAAAAGQIAAQGPRGGKRWVLRRFVRRLAWHVLDHAWEIEDRLGEQ